MNIFMAKPEISLDLMNPCICKKLVITFNATFIAKVPKQQSIFSRHDFLCCIYARKADSSCMETHTGNLSFCYSHKW